MIHHSFRTVLDDLFYEHMCDPYAAIRQIVKLFTIPFKGKAISVDDVGLQSGD